MRHLLALLVLALAAAVVAASARPAREGAFTLRGTVTYVVDGDTLNVRLDGGRRERVRLIGIDTPERGACLSGPAAAQARRLAEDKRRPRNVWRGCPVPAAPPAAAPRASCDPSYPTVCIPPPPPDLDCADVSYSNFAVRGADPHRFDGEGDGVGCEG